MGYALRISALVYLGYVACRLLVRDAVARQFVAYMWTLSASVSLALVVVAWLPGLDSNSNPDWGYDAQRYWQIANESDDWLSLVRLTNYPGIIAYVRLSQILVPGIAGPVLANMLLLLVAACLAVRAIGALRILPKSRVKYVALIMLWPDLLWFSALPGKESITASLSLIAIASVIVAAMSKRFVALGWLLAAIGALLGLVLVRPPAGVVTIAVLFGFGLYWVARDGHFIPRGATALTAVVVAVAAGLAAVGLGVNQTSGVLSLGDQKDVALAAAEDGSLVEFLANSSQAVQVFSTPLRAGVAIVGPLLPQSLMNSISAGPASYIFWQGLSTALSSVLIIALLPLVVAAGWKGLRAGALEPTIALWTAMMVVAGGTILITDRYRLIWAPWIVICAIQGAGQHQRAIEPAH